MSTVIQLLLSLVAAYSLFWIFRRSDARWIRARSIIAAGFLLRAVAGQVLFWISYLNLPIASGLQLGNGFWFWGLDGQGFFNLAATEAAKGIEAVLFVDRLIPAAVYVQVLAIFIRLFGAVASVGLLLNLFCYLGTCAAIARWGKETSGGIIALLAVSFTPSWVLWALQPMKDPFLVFMTVLFLFALARLQERWMPVPAGTSALWWVASLILLVVPLYALAGTRWYFAMALLLGTVFFTMLLVLGARGFRLRILGVSLLILVALSQVLVWGAGPYLPQPFRRVLVPLNVFESLPESPRGVVEVLNQSRLTQEAVRGSTTLQAGRKLDIAPGPTVPDLPKPDSSTEAPQAASVRTEAQTKGISPSSPASRLSSRVEQLLVGLTAMVVPRAVASKLGLLELGGGRGLWFFAEVDTLVFDAFLVVAVLSLIQAGRTGGFSRPILWPVMLLTVLIALAVSYVSTNFGTMFRHREMVLIGLCLLPLAVNHTGGILMDWRKR